MNQDFTPVIGMEVHVELSTKSKMFCSCPADHFHVPPNTHVCPVCLGLPGALPVPNKQAVEDIIKIGLALNCRINLFSKFDRKHYFYPDLPKGYQISQHDQPFCTGGYVELKSGKKIRLTRVHLEEDTGKLIHKTIDGKRVSLVDYNRSSVPLVEIVSEPDISSAEEAKEYLKIIHSTVRFLGVSDADMEKGSMRLEANISVSSDGKLPPYKVEVKNVNSFRYIAAAINYEIARHTRILLQGELPKQETRGYSATLKKTLPQRSKEEAKDYRYFPEPDIPPITLTQEYVADLQSSLPVLPEKVVSTLKDAGFRDDYAQEISKNKEQSKYFFKVTSLIESNKEANLAASAVINNRIDWTKHTPEELVNTIRQQKNRQTLSQEETEKLVDEVIAANPAVVAEYKRGKTTSIEFFVGQVMARSRGQASATLARDLLTLRLQA